MLDNVTIDTLTTGRILDRLVAEHVMCLDIRGDETCLLPQACNSIYTLHLRYSPFHIVERIEGDCDDYMVLIPSYSTDIAAAWCIVERLRSIAESPEQCFWTLTDCSAEGWRVKLENVITENDTPGTVTAGNGETLPLALCRAALHIVKREMYWFLPGSWIPREDLPVRPPLSFGWATAIDHEK